MFEYKAYVRSVYDGDTLRADFSLGFHSWQMDIPLRLHRINCPELGTWQGRVVRDYVRALLPNGAEFYVRTHKDEQEKYGRYLADIYPQGFTGYCLNDMLVEKNMAVYWDGSGERPVPVMIAA